MITHARLLGALIKSLPLTFNVASLIKYAINVASLFRTMLTLVTQDTCAQHTHEQCLRAKP